MGARGSGSRLLDVVEELLADLPGRVRGSRTRISDQAVGGLKNLADELGIVSREEYEELELRVAQLEHRLRLLEEHAPRDLPPAA